MTPLHDPEKGCRFGNSGFSSGWPRNQGEAEGNRSRISAVFLWKMIKISTLLIFQRIQPWDLLPQTPLFRTFKIVPAFRTPNDRGRSGKSGKPDQKMSPPIAPPLLPYKSKIFRLTIFPLLFSIPPQYNFSLRVRQCLRDNNIEASFLG